jgi:hypothetical protein
VGYAEDRALVASCYVIRALAHCGLRIRPQPPAGTGLSAVLFQLRSARVPEDPHYILASNRLRRIPAVQDNARTVSLMFPSVAGSEVAP